MQRVKDGIHVRIHSNHIDRDNVYFWGMEVYNQETQHESSPVDPRGNISEKQYSNHTGNNFPGQQCRIKMA